MKHQVVSLKHDASTNIVYDVSDPGTGKTAVRIWAFAKRHKRHGKKAMILATRSIMWDVWKRDFFKFEPTLRVAVCDAKNRHLLDDPNFDVYVVNHDAVKDVAKKKDSWWKTMGFDELVVDESTAFKNPTSQRTRAAHRIAKHFTHRSCLTGTPNSNTITDVWPQVYILDGGHRLGPSFYGFRSATCEPVQVGRKREAIRWKDKDGAKEAVFSMLADIVVRHEFDKCVDIPQNVVRSVPYTLTKKQLEKYIDMEDTQLLIDKKTGSVAVTAINAGAVMTKLLQIASGAVYDGKGNTVLIDDERYKYIIDLATEAQHSLVFFLWKHQRDALVKVAEQRGLTFCVLDGDSTDKERGEMVERYQRGEYRIMFAHPKSAAHGLTLTRGTRTIWSSPTWDLEMFKQGSKRQARIGQKFKTDTLVVCAEETVETDVYDMMLAKDARMTNLLDLFAHRTAGK